MSEDDAVARGRMEATLEGHTQQLAHIDEIVSRIVSVAVTDMKKEVRWLIVLSVGMNQLIYNVDISSVAKAAIAGSVVSVWAGAKVLISFGLWH